MPPVEPKWSAAYPVIACTPAELARLRAAWQGTDAAHAPVAAMVAGAEQALKTPLVFPPRGGQHNQWYQCDRCQRALKTIDPTHHQCPQCRHVYSGEPYDDVIFSRVHGANLAGLMRSAWAYALTGETRFADFGRQVLLGYAERYLQYPYHSAGRGQGTWDRVAGGRLFEQTLNEASYLVTDLAPAYDLLHDAPVLTPADHERIRQGLLLPMLASIDRNQAGMSNWQTWHNAAMLWGGAVLRDPAWVTKALTAKDNGFFHQMEVSVTADGMWYENSWGYHFYTLTAMVAIAEGARRLGLDLWTTPRFKAMFTLPLRYAMPDGSLPRFGDDVRTGLAAAQKCLEFAYHAGPDDTMLPGLAPQPTWDSVMLGRTPAPERAAPALASEVFRAAGHAVLRTTAPAGLAAVLTFGPYGGFHGHFDKLGFVFFGQGTELGVDPGRAASQAYRLPIHTNWYKATLSHNTVLVDRHSQAGVGGELKCFVANATHAAALAACAAAYPGTRHQRLLVLTPSYLLVADELVSAADRRCDWLYHHRSTAAVCPVATEPVKFGADFPGGEYLANTRRGITGDPIRVEFKSGDLTTWLTMAGQAGTEVVVGDGPGAAVDDRVPLAMIGRRGSHVYFAATLEPVKGTAPVVTDVRLTEKPGRLQIDVVQARGTDTILVHDGRQVEVKSNAQTVLQSD